MAKGRLEGVAERLEAARWEDGWPGFTVGRPHWAAPPVVVDQRPLEELRGRAARLALVQGVGAKHVVKEQLERVGGAPSGEWGRLLLVRLVGRQALARRRVVTVRNARPGTRLVGAVRQLLLRPKL